MLTTALTTACATASSIPGRPNSFAYVQFDTEDAAERVLNRSGDELMGRPIELSLSASAVEAGGKLGKPVEGCWFCLSNVGADIDLVVSVGAKFGWLLRFVFLWEFAMLHSVLSYTP